MTANTSKYVIQYPTSSDAVPTLASTGQNMAQRLDLLLGETGSVSFTGTTGSSALVFGRTYPGNVGATVPGILVVNFSVTLSTTTIVNWWVNNWTGTATTITGCTLNFSANASLTARVFAWRFLPVL